MENKKPLIGLDIDGVLADFGGYFLDYLGIKDKSAPKMWNDPRFSENYHKVTKDINFWLNIPTLVNPKDLEFEPRVYVTARPIPSHVSRQWLLNNGFPDCPVFTTGTDGSKVKFLKDSIDVFLDDAFHNYEELNNSGVNCVLMSRSHNLHNNVKKRVKDINEIVNYVNLS